MLLVGEYFTCLTRSFGSVSLTYSVLQTILLFAVVCRGFGAYNAPRGSYWCQPLLLGSSALVTLLVQEVQPREPMQCNGQFKHNENYKYSYWQSSFSSRIICLASETSFPSCSDCQYPLVLQNLLLLPNQEPFQWLDSSTGSPGSNTTKSDDQQYSTRTHHTTQPTHIKPRDFRRA